MRFGLRNKLLVVNVLVVLFTGIFILIFLRNSLLESLQKEVQKRGIFMAGHLAKIVVDDLLTEDIVNLKLKIYEYKRTDNDIVYIFISNNHGETIAHTFAKGFPVELKRLGSSNMTGDYYIERFNSEMGRIYDISAPILNGQLGIIHIGLTERTIKEGIATMVRTVIMAISIIFFFSTVILLYLSLKITRPLKDLKLASEELAKGNFHYRVHTKSTDEIGLLGKTFNFMAERIEGMYREIKESHDKLEDEIHERKAVQVQLDKSIRFLNSIYDSIVDPFVIIDRNFNIVRVNNAYASLKGKKIEQLINKRCYRELAEREDICEGCVIEKTIVSGDPCSKEKRVVLPDGSEVWLNLYTYPIYDKDGVITHVIEYTIDITDKKRVEEQRKLMIRELERLSRTDSLTGLLNRRALIEILEYNLKRAKRYNTKVSLVIVDIDNFKAINDSYGHPVGDEVIRQVSSVIKDTLRTLDIVGRYGGDEFLLILPETTLEGALELSERIRRVVEMADFIINEGFNIKTTISLGVIDCTDLNDLEEVIRVADDALYTSKRKGRNRTYTAGT